MDLKSFLFHGWIVKFPILWWLIVMVAIIDNTEGSTPVHNTKSRARFTLGISMQQDIYIWFGLNI